MAAAAPFVQSLQEIAARQPDAPAVLDGGRVALRYGELVDRAAVLGDRLRGAGAGRESIVALALNRSPAWIVSVVGTWWAGAAWMPLPTGTPPERGARMRETSRCSHVVESPSSRDELSVTAVGGPAPKPAATGGDDHLAYVIYTSGSRGRPKGVAVTHRGLVPMLEAQIELFHLGPGARSLWTLSPAFDASVSDIGTALLSGAALCIEPRCATATPDALMATMARRCITFADLPPSLLARLDPAAAPPSLKTVVIGGERCDPAAVRRWARAVRLINVYGPTEATVCTSAGLCGPDWSAALLGPPLAGVRYRVADGDGAECPEGAPGELWIAGPQLARGYLGDDALTAERFVVRDGARWYRSGDRVVRRGRDHEFLGRIDRQLKVRGMLVAPEEIEAALCRQPGVTRAAVVNRPVHTREGGAGPVGLIGFIEGTGVSSEQLCRALRRELPPWMVPARLHVMPALPTTASGKIELPALVTWPLPAMVGAGGAPQCDQQRKVARWLEDALRLDSGALGVDDDFYALGGDSLAAVEVIASAARDGVALGPELLSRFPTVAGLSVALARAPAALHDERAAVATLDSDAWPSFRIPAPPSDLTGNAPHHIVMTGATGFLGRRVLAALLQRRDQRITCVVRPRGGSPAQRLARACPAAAPHLGQRVEAVAGELEAPDLGLEADTWTRLCGEADTVLHLGAQVSVSRSYAELFAANVGGSEGALRLACSGRPKVLHYASTLSVFVSADRDGSPAPFLESDDLGSTRAVHGGYARSKWVAERLLRRAAPWPVTHFRLGLLTGDTRRGHMPTEHWLPMFIRGVAALGCVPGDLDPALAFDVTPVDHAAGAVASLVVGGASGTYHIAGARPARLTELLEAIRRAGVPVKDVSLPAFRRVARDHGVLGAAAQLALSRLDPAPRSRLQHRALDLFQATGVSFDRRRAEAAGIAAPDPEAALLDRYVGAALGPAPSPARTRPPREARA